MDSTSNWNGSDMAVQAVDASADCAICSRRASEGMLTVHERFAQPMGPLEPQTWLVCAACAAAVVAEVERAALRTPLRLRVAAGIVAAERRPQQRSAIRNADYWALRSQGDMETVVARLVLVLFALASLVFLLTMVFGLL